MQGVVLVWARGGGRPGATRRKNLRPNRVSSPFPSSPPADKFQWSGSTILAVESGLCLSTAYVPPPPPPPPGTCTSAGDCNLNGECVSGRCVCYKPWTGSLNCGELAFLPTPLHRGYPPASANETTWGGSIARNPGDGYYHMVTTRACVLCVCVCVCVC